MDPQVNPFAVLSLIVAPAILTNASSVLAMSTSNRFARAVDRARDLSRQIEQETDIATPEAARHRRELAAAEQRSLMILAALRSFYLALGSFASATLLSLLGAAVAPWGSPIAVQTLEILGVCAGFVALGALVHGSVMLIRETRIVVDLIHERAEFIRTRTEGQKQL